MDALHARITGNPAFHALQARRSRLAWTLCAGVLAAYYGFILMIAYAPDTFRQPLHEGTSVTLGVAWGMAVVVICIALTGVYVWRANREFDRLNAQILEEATRDTAA